LAETASTGDDEVAVIGGGPAGLMAAEVLSAAGCAVTIYERMPSLGRKFLLAGRGGLNLTHSENRADFIARYEAAAGALEPNLDAFPPGALAAWCDGLGVPTFVGSSGRVFPGSFKSSPLLRAWLRRLDDQGVRFRPRHLWTGWDKQGALTFEIAGENADKEVLRVTPKAVVLALGGASWPRLGSDGRWLSILNHAGVETADLHPANCGCEIAWSPVFRERFEGAPLKRIAVTCGPMSVQGEAMITKAGLEGGAIYALSARVRESLLGKATAPIRIDLRPDIGVTALGLRLQRPRGKQTLTNHVRKAAGLSAAAVGLLREDIAGPELPLEPEALARRIKAVTLSVTGIPDLDRAISTAGGVTLRAVDARLMLREKPGVFVAGEMLDWEAPTGGYLLQACFSTGHAAARGVLHWLGRSPVAGGLPVWSVPVPLTPAPLRSGSAQAGDGSEPVA
jgi:uncharacterized flavoprotein (TIGR03862 family)